MTDDADGGGFETMDLPHRQLALNVRRWMLGVLEGLEVVPAAGTDPRAITQLCETLAAIAAGQMVAHAVLERHLSDAEAHAESVAGLRGMITELELLALDDGDAPFPGGLPLPESAMLDDDVMDMTPAVVGIRRRVWGYLADVAVEGRHPSLPAAELTEIAEGLAGLVLGLFAGVRGDEAAAQYVLAQRDLYGSLDAGD